MIYTYEHNGQPYSINLEVRADGSFRAVIGDREYIVSAAQTADGGWRLNIDGARSLAYTAIEGNKRHVQMDGTQFTVTVPDARASRRRASSSGGEAGSLRAQMPGQVTAVLVSEGDSVTRGQPLVILEAMKMEIRAASPGDGMVKRLFVKQGDVVERGQVLVEVE